MPTTIAPLIPIAFDLLVSLIKVARNAKELSNAELETIKRKIDAEFTNFPHVEDL